ncbi:MAG: AAA family ATPase [Flavobacteriales bacterium]
MIKRAIEIEKELEKNKVLIIYGPRQVGKTTLLNDFLSNTKLDHKLFTGDDLEFANDLAKCDLNLIKKMFIGLELIIKRY